MLRTESPRQGYRLTAASLPAPLSYVPKERMGEETAAALKERRWWKDSPGSTNPPICTYRSEALSQTAQEPWCGAGSTPHAGGSFFLYEKSVLRESDCLRGRSKEVCTNSTPPLFRPKKSPSNNGNPRGIPSPWQEARRVKAAGFDPWTEPSRSSPPRADQGGSLYRLPPWQSFSGFIPARKRRCRAGSTCPGWQSGSGGCPAR